MKGVELISIKSPREIEADAPGRADHRPGPGPGWFHGGSPASLPMEIDTAVRRFIESHGAKPSFLGYGGFPGSACISVNDEVIHGIPGPRKLKEGDIVSVDVGAFIWTASTATAAATYACGQISDQARKLIEVTQQSFWEGIKMARTGLPGVRYRPCGPGRMWRPTASLWSGTMWVTVWAQSSTRPQRYVISAPQATAPVCCPA